MKIQSILKIVAITMALTISAPVFACSAAGPDIHVGTVVSVDKIAGTFTILDAESGSPVTLTADVPILEQAKSSTQVIVRYRNDGGTLKAIELK